MAEVTREHREMAVTALMLGVRDSVIMFVDTGEERESEDESLEEASRVAQAIADADARGYARCQADVVAWLEAESRERFVESEQGYGPDMQGELAALGETFSGLAGAVGKGAHVGAAGKAGG